ncbi:caspase family protein [Paraclostridium bifermentans]|uniref:caspase family protein n=1 Tax=Paraclostridium bifermentans TaxID=1490 RepID=UPI00374E6BAF
MKKALIIGLDNYPNARLKGCINDAKNISSELARNNDSSPNFECKLITDEKNSISKGVLRNEIESLFEGHCDTALLYFSGHGLIKSTGGYIVTPDWCNGDEGISMDSILILANNSHAKNKVIILDCCHSGSFGSPALNQKNITQIADGVTILTASRKTELAIECNGGGVFTSLLIEGLKGAATDLMGNVTLANLYSYIDSALGAWSQRPIFKTNTSTFSPIKKVNPLVDINLLRKICYYFENYTDEYNLNPSYEDTYYKKESKEYDPENIKKFKELQKLQSVGLVVPCNCDFMYFAAIESKSCKLTSLGHRYWRLAKENKI